ncbi:MAG: hypothetical protein FJW88_14460 [Actinobacteria bacterium]|nr:hypothetical protein [Actinomycetota bacterium]
MALRSMITRLRTPVEVLDAEQLVTFFADLGLTALDALPLRVPVRFGGEISAIRLVPRAAAPSLEITVSDGRGSAVAVFLGRATVPGMTSGRRLELEGVALRDGRRVLVYNPWYRFLSH